MIEICENGCILIRFDKDTFVEEYQNTWYTWVGIDLSTRDYLLTNSAKELILKEFPTAIFVDGNKDCTYTTVVFSPEDECWIRMRVKYD